MTESLYQQTNDSPDKKFEQSLRPPGFEEFHGQEKVTERLMLMVEAAKMRDDVLEHILLSGPPGLGKTTLANIISTATGTNLHTSSGPQIEKAGDLAGILTNIQKGDILFIDEIHRMARPAEEMLYLAMEDFRIDIMVGKGAGATTLPLDLAPFTLVGATTRSGLLPGPLRDRFGFTAHLEFYSAEELTEVVRRSSAMLGLTWPSEALAEIAGRSRGTPRIANRLLRRVRDYVLVHKSEPTMEAVHLALELYDVDELGLDRLDRAVLDALIVKFQGGPVGLGTLSVSVGEETETIESVVEPFLVRQGFIQRTPRGRVATPGAYAHLGHQAPGLNDL